MRRTFTALLALAALGALPGAGPPVAAEEFPAPAAAPAEAPDSGLTEEVLVRARAPRPEDAAFATVVPADELARRGADLSDLLRRVPGARVTSYGGIGQFATVSLRGSTAWALSRDPSSPPTKGSVIVRPSTKKLVSPARPPRT